MSRVLRGLREQFDFIVVDTAPAFDDQTLTALDETDECVIVATLDVPTLKNVKVAIETLETLNIAPGHRHLLLNRADDQVGLGAEKVETILGMPVATMIPTSLDIAAATNAGTPILAANPGPRLERRPARPRRPADRRARRAPCRRGRDRHRPRTTGPAADSGSAGEHDMSSLGDRLAAARKARPDERVEADPDARPGVDADAPAEHRAGRPAAPADRADHRRDPGAASPPVTSVGQASSRRTDRPAVARARPRPRLGHAVGPSARRAGRCAPQQ